MFATIDPNSLPLGANAQNMATTMAQQNKKKKLKLIELHLKLP
jgi:hypothetical protein